MGVEFMVNGRQIRADRVPPQTTLLDFLRASGLTGAKEGCAEGECGACTVVMVVDAPGGSTFHTVNSCLMFVPMAAHQEIYTVEALAAGGELADAQAAIAAAGGSQCGYCTPGFVMSLFAEQYRPDRTGPCDTHALAGNLCRCTGYRPIRDAVLSLGPARDDTFRARLGRPAPALSVVDTEGFSRPSTVDECVTLLARDPSAAPIAGATDLGVESNLRSRRWPRLVSLEGVSALREFSDAGDRVHIGASLTLSDLGRRWHGAPAVLREWLDLFGSPPIRNRATLGGNLATASPIGDAAPLLLALDAAVRLEGPGGRRSLPLAGFFTGYRRTVLQRAELLTGIDLPTPHPQFVRFYKIAKRPVDDISTVTAAMAIDTDAANRVTRARFAFGGVAATPVRVTDAERAVEGQPWNKAAVERVQQMLERTLTPMSDHRGSKEYRLQVAMSLVEKFWWERVP